MDRRPKPRSLSAAIALGAFAAFLAAGCGGGGSPISTAGLVSIRTSALPRGTAGAAYDARIDASGPHEPLTWLVTGGRLPPGVSLDAGSGTLSGFPRVPARFHVEVEVRDGPDAAGARDASFAATRRGFDVVVEPGPLAVLPFPLAPAEFAASFLHRFEAAGGEAPCRFDLAAGTLPEGLVLETDGTLRGAPRSAGVPYRPVIRATDAVGATATREFELTVVVLPLRVATASMPDAAQGFPYDAALDARPAGAGAPFAWSVAPSAAALPPGLRVERDTGRVVGTPTRVGTMTFTLEVVDAVGQRATRDVSIRVNAGPVLTAVAPKTLPAGGAPVTVTGQGFQPGMTVAFGFADAVGATVVDSTRATVVPPTNPLPSGAVAVRVTNPDGGFDEKPAAFRYPYAVVEFVAQGVKGGTRDHSRAIAAGDVNGDGLCDVAHVGSLGIEILRPTGPAWTGAWTTKVVRGDGSYNDVKLADVDADGDLDLVVSRSSTTDTIEVYRNDGAGNFPSAASVVTTYPRPSSFHFPFALATGDVNGDGVVDVAFTSGRGGQGCVWIYKGLGDGAFVEAYATTDAIHDDVAGCYAPNSIALADLDGDGRDDVVVTDAFPAACAAGQTCPTTPATNAWPGSGDLVAWVSLSPAAGTTRTWRGARVVGSNGRLDGDNLGLAVYDHDGDGRRDLAVFGGYLSQRGSGIAWLSGDGAGRFTERFTRPTAYTRRFGARIDANGDGFEDVFVVGGDAPVASGAGSGWSVAECWLGGTTEVPVKAWASGSEFAAGGSIPGANPGRVAVGDFDGDGRDDVAIDQSFNAKERFANEQGDGPVEGVAIYLNRSH